jgi:hypothetical protein
MRRGRWRNGNTAVAFPSMPRCIEADDRAGRERLLRYCARRPFALGRLHELDPERLPYESAE